jgi:hypothetical protein
MGIRDLGNEAEAIDASPGGLLPRRKFARLTDESSLNNIF